MALRRLVTKTAPLAAELASGSHGSTRRRRRRRVLTVASASAAVPVTIVSTSATSTTAANDNAATLAALEAIRAELAGANEQRGAVETLAEMKEQQELIARQIRANEA